MTDRILFARTMRQDGQRRNYQKGSDRYNAKLDAAKVREIRRLAGTVKNMALAAEYGVSEGAIEHVINFRTWAHVK